MSTQAVAIEDPKTGDIAEVVYGHPFIVRLCHWANAVSLFVKICNSTIATMQRPAFH